MTQDQYERDPLPLSCNRARQSETSQVNEICNTCPIEWVITHIQLRIVMLMRIVTNMRVSCHLNRSAANHKSAPVEALDDRDTTHAYLGHFLSVCVTYFWQVLIHMCSCWSISTNTHDLVLSRLQMSNGTHPRHTYKCFFCMFSLKHDSWILVNTEKKNHRKWK